MSQTRTLSQRSLEAAERKQRFLDAFAVTGKVAQVCRELDIPVTQVYKWRVEDEKFALDWEACRRMVGEVVLETEAMRRAVEGVDEPVFYKGQECGAVRKYSDAVLLATLRANLPDRYGDKKFIDLSGSLDLGKMSEDDLRAELAKLLAGVTLPDVGDAPPVEETFDDLV